MTRKLPLDFKSPIPIFQQIVNEFERQILVGELREGDFLPSVREFAINHTINPNTVAKAYQALQVLDLAEAVRGKGLVVKKLREKLATSRRDDIIQEKVRELIKIGESLKLSVGELAQLVIEIGSKP